MQQTPFPGLHLRVAVLPSSFLGVTRSHVLLWMIVERLEVSRGHVLLVSIACASWLHGRNVHDERRQQAV